MHSSGASSASLHQRARGRRGTQEFNYQRQQRQKQQQFQARTHALTFVSFISIIAMEHRAHCPCPTDSRLDEAFRP